MTARHYLAMTDRALAEQIVESWRGDFSEFGRALKAAGVGGRNELTRSITQVVERAANESEGRQ